MRGGSPVSLPRVPLLDLENTVALAAHEYRTAGFRPIPIPARSKAPTIAGWQHLQITAAEIPQLFPASGNIGLLVGEAGNGLTDVDLDSKEAAALAPAFLPATGWVHGRASRPHAHYWYLCPDVPEHGSVNLIWPLSIVSFGPTPTLVIRNKLLGS
jgi:hypothetical protein